MGKGTNNHIALLQGLLATFTGGSLILFAVLAATIGLSTPQSQSPSVAGGGRGSGGAVTVPGIGGTQNGRETATGPGPGSPATAGPSGAPGSSPTTPTVVADGAAVNPAEPTSAVAQTSGEIGLQIPQFLTPGTATATGPQPPIGAPILRPGFVATTNDGLPDSFKDRFGAGNALGARNVDKADRVAKHLGPKVLRKAAKAPVKATRKVTSKAHRRGGPAVGGGKTSGKSARGEPAKAKQDKTATKEAEREQRTNAKDAAREERKESKKADKETKRETKEAKKEDRGRSAIDDGDDDDD